MNQASVQASKQLRGWQTERAKILHLVCRRIQTRENVGQARLKSVKLFARRWNGKSFKCDPSRRLRLNAKTLYRVYLNWLRNGETPAAFRLNFFPGNRRIAAPVLVRFIRFCAKHDFKSFRAAWEAFTNGRGKIGCDALYWNLPTGCFRELKKRHKAKRLAESALSAAAIRFMAKIESRVPAKLSCAHAKGNLPIGKQMCSPTVPEFGIPDGTTGGMK